MEDCARVRGTLMEPELFIITYPQTTKYAETASMDNVKYDYDRVERCPLCGRSISGGFWMQPRKVALTNRRAPDFLYSYSCEPFLISERALAVIRREGLIGIKGAQEIEYVRFQRKGKKEIPVPKYYFIELVRSRMTINHEKSSIVYGRQDDGPYTKPCPLCHPVPKTYDFLRHLEFHTEQYEGYDIFFTYELGETAFLSKRFVDVCRENGLTNLHFRPAAKYGTKEAKYFLDGIEDDNDEDDMVSN